MAIGLEIRAQIDAEIAKALLYLNGGGVIVMLPLVPFFLQHKDGERMAFAILVGALILIFGLFFAVLHNRYLRRCSLAYEQVGMSPTTRPKDCVVSTIFWFLSLSMFLIAGCLVTIYGLHVLRHYGPF